MWTKLQNISWNNSIDLCEPNLEYFWCLHLSWIIYIYLVHLPPQQNDKYISTTSLKWCLRYIHPHENKICHKWKLNIKIDKNCKMFNVFSILTTEMGCILWCLLSFRWFLYVCHVFYIHHCQHDHHLLRCHQIEE